MEERRLWGRWASTRQHLLLRPASGPCARRWSGRRPVRQIHDQIAVATPSSEPRSFWHCLVLTSIKKLVRAREDNCKRYLQSSNTLGECLRKITRRLCKSLGEPTIYCTTSTYGVSAPRLAAGCAYKTFIQCSETRYRCRICIVPPIYHSALTLSIISHTTRNSSSERSPSSHSSRSQFVPVLM